MFLKHLILMNQAGDPQGGGAGGEGDKPPAFDPTAFEKKIMDGVNAAINGFGKNFEKKFEKVLKPDPKPDDPPAPDPKPDDKTDPKANAEILKLQRQLEVLTKKTTEAEEARTKAENQAKETARKTAIETALNGFQFANENARLAAFRLYDAEVRYNDDGVLVAGKEGSELPVADFIKSSMRDHEYFLAPKSTGGSGMSPSGGKSGGKVYTLDDIKPDMKPEERAAIRTQIANQLQQ